MIEIQAPDGSIIQFPDGTPDATIEGVMQENYGGPKPQVGVGEDMTKGAAAGVAQGTLSLGGLAGDAQNLFIDRPMEWVLGKMGYSPEQAQTASAVRRSTGTFGNAPTSEQLTGMVEKQTGPMYQAQTVPGQYAQTAGQFAPSALLGPGGVAKKALIGGSAAIASETAGQATKGSDAEPYARLGGALLGGGAASLGRGKQPALAPTTEQLRTQKNALYSAAEGGVGKIKMTRTHVQNLARGFNEVGKDTNKGGVLSSMTDDLYKGTNATISKFNKVAQDVVDGNVPPPTFGELESLRQNLNAAVRQNIGPTGKLTADGTMSARLVEQIDDMFINTPFKEAGAAYRTLIKAEKMERAFKMAELNAGANYTQAGMERAIQGQFKKLASDKNFTKLFTKEEQAAIEGVVKIGGVHKFMKRFGALAPSGAISTMFNIGTTYSNPMIGIPLGVGASAAKYGSTARTLGKAARTDELIRRGGKAVPKPSLLRGSNIPRLGLLGNASQANN